MASAARRRRGGGVVVGSCGSGVRSFSRPFRSRPIWPGWGPCGGRGSGAGAAAGGASGKGAAEEDFYELLSLERGASEQEVKTSFRRLAREWHPDVNKEPGAHERFQKIARAYEVLSNEESRKMYDRFGEAGLGGGATAHPGPNFSGMNLEDILGDMFGSIFGRAASSSPGGAAAGRARAAQRQRQGADLELQVMIPFDEACFGGDRTVSVRREETCRACEGHGAAPGKTRAACQRCDGTGHSVQVLHTALGLMQTQQACSACGGSGLDPSSVCGACAGRGTTRELREVAIKIPAGCMDGSQLRARGEGDRGTLGGPSGDLYISVRVARSKDFDRDGADIFTDSHVSVWDAILGASLRVQTIDGHAEVTLPAGTQPESRLRIRGRGVPKLGFPPGERGDHYVTVKVDVPQGLEPSAVDLVAQLRQRERSGQ